MSLSSHFRHTLVIKYLADDTYTDDYGQPETVETTLATVPGLLQPRAEKDVPLTSQAGAAISDGVAFLAPLDGLTTRCWVECDGDRWDILAVKDAAGMGHHVELALKRVT